MELSYLIENLTWPIVAIFVGIFVFKNFDKIELMIALIARAFASKSRKAERTSVSSDIQSKLSSYIKKYHVENVLPYGIKFKWITGKNFESYVENGDVIILMDNHANNAKNFVKAIVAYTSKGFVPEIRPYVPKKVLLASELVIDEKIILEKRSDGIDYFRDIVCEDLLNKVPGARDYKEKFDYLEKANYFDNIFIPELIYSGPKFKGVYIGDSTEDTDSFISLVSNVATKQPGDESFPLSVEGTVFRVSIILIAKYEKISSSMGAYVRRVRIAKERNYDSAYLLARNYNVKYIESIIKEISKQLGIKPQWKKTIQTLDKKGNPAQGGICLFRFNSESETKSES